MKAEVPKGPRTWEPTWATDNLQYAYDRGVFEGVVVFIGLMDMAKAIRQNFICWACDCHIGPKGCCYCQYFDEHECKPTYKTADDTETKQ